MTRTRAKIESMISKEELGKRIRNLRETRVFTDFIQVEPHQCTECGQLHGGKKYKLNSQKWLADKLGISRALLSMVETGKRDLRMTQMIRLSELFGVSIDDLIK